MMEVGKLLEGGGKAGSQYAKMLSGADLVLCCGEWPTHRSCTLGLPTFLQKEASI